MKVSISKFYQEVTGANTANLRNTTAALKRWGVPFDESTKSTDRVEVRYLDAAREAYRKEVTEREARKRARTKPEPSNDGQTELPLDHRTSPLRGIHEALEAHGQALGRIEEMVAHIHKDLYEKRTR